MNYGIKTVLVGESSVGKTSVVSRLRNVGFSRFSESTIGASFSRLNINNRGYDIWDTAGQERYKSLVSIYYREAKIFLIVFDLSNLSTLEELDEYYFNTIIERCTSDYKCIVIGNKADLVNEETIKRVDKDIRERFKQYEAQLPLPLSFVYTSALANDNMNELILEIGKAGEELHVRKMMTKSNSSDNKNDDVVNLSIVNRITSFLPTCPC